MSLRTFSLIQERQRSLALSWAVQPVNLRYLLRVTIAHTF